MKLSPRTYKVLGLSYWLSLVVTVYFGLISPSGDDKLRVIGQLERKKVGPVRILAGLSEATPEKLWLTEFADAGGTLKLTGLGVDEQTVADFMRRLGTLSFFRTVDLDETSQVTQDGAKVKKFVFHNYRNTALTDWADEGIHVDVAMQASGHTSVQMHKRYVGLQRHHIAKAFGLKRPVTQKSVTKKCDQEPAKEAGGAAN